MIDFRNLRKLGVPPVPDVMKEALKAANIAVAAGHAPEDVTDLIGELVRQPDAAGAGRPAALMEALAPLAALLREDARRRIAFVPRETPAPWRRWGGDDVEEGAIGQMENACRLPVAAGGALMPDAHTGYGLPIGGVLAVRGAVIPYAVGVDIACRMRLSVLDVPVADLDEHEDRFVSALKRETRFGVGAAFKPGERRHPVMEADWKVSPVTAGCHSKAALQLGTSGSGNHFAEFGILTLERPCRLPGFTLEAGRWTALLTHSGSRAAGEAVAKFYSEAARDRHPEIPAEMAHLAWLELDSEPGREYWEAMTLMGAYASANHELIHRHVAAALGVGVLASVENHHNFAWKEDCGGEELIIHRKGATPAWEDCLGVIPGSMCSPGFVVRGRGCAEAWRSCSHGAGRRMSRGAAFRELSREAMRELLAERGVRLLSGSLDESPEAYKDIETVMAAQADLMEILARFDPRIVRMAPEKHPRPSRKRGGTTAA